jgi:hypothetical protein
MKSADGKYSLHIVCLSAALDLGGSARGEGRVLKIPGAPRLRLLTPDVPTGPRAGPDL